MEYLLAVVYATIDQEKITYPALPFEEIFTRITVFVLRLFGSSAKEAASTAVHTVQYVGTFAAILLLFALFALRFVMKRFEKEDDAKYKKPSTTPEPKKKGKVGSFLAAAASVVSFEKAGKNKHSSDGAAKTDNRDISEKAWGGIVSYVATGKSGEDAKSGVDETTTTSAVATDTNNTSGGSGAGHAPGEVVSGGANMQSGSGTLAADSYASSGARNSLWGSDSANNSANAGTNNAVNADGTRNPFATQDNDTLGGMGAIGGYATEDNQKKWQRIINHCESVNPTDWRLAILEADILLGEMLIAMGAHGQTLGERLKSVGRGALPALDKAWDAHKVRNAIAHEGADVVITHHEARRVIKLYEEVLKSGLFIR